MLIKHFKMFAQRVPDPMQPGRTAVVGRLRPSGTIDPFGFTDPHTGDERTVDPDADGYFDVPQEIGVQQCRFRDNGSGFYEKGQVEEEVRLGNVEPDVPHRSSSRAKRTSSSED